MANPQITKEFVIGAVNKAGEIIKSGIKPKKAEDLLKTKKKDIIIDGEKKAEYMGGWAACLPYFQKKGPPGSIQPNSPAAPFFFNIAGRLASQPCIWLPPSILGIFHRYWYIIGHIFFIMVGISSL